MNAAQLEELECLHCVFQPSELQVIGTNKDECSGATLFELVFCVSDPESDGTSIGVVDSNDNDITKTKSLYLTVKWPAGYLSAESSEHEDSGALPVISIDGDERNSQLPPAIRSQIAAFISQKTEELSGDQMTLAIVEALKDEAFTTFGVREFIESLSLAESSPGQPEQEKEGEEDEDGVEESEEIVPEKVTTAPARDATLHEELKGLTKAQKRRYHDRVRAADGMHPRGWNWVDIVSHLSKGPLGNGQGIK